MARYIKQFDPEETHRRIAVDIQEAHCPGLLEFLSTLPFGYEGPGLRAIVYQWFLAREADGTLHDAFESVVSGPGGLSGTRQLKKKAQTTRRPSTRPLAQPAKPKRALRATQEETTPAVSPTRDAAGGPEPSQSVDVPSVGQSLPPSREPAVLQQPTDIAISPPSSVHAESPSVTPIGEEGPVDPDKITPLQYQMLMGLDTMFE